MNNLKKSLLGFYLRQLLSMILAVNLILVGFPVKSTQANDGSEGMRIEGQTPRLLREPEPVEDCNQYLKTIENLELMYNDSVQRRARENARRLIQSAEEDKREAYERAWKEAIKELKDIGLGLAMDRLKVLHEKEALLKRYGELTAKVGEQKAEAWLSLSKRLNDLLQNTDSLLNKMDRIEKELNRIETMPSSPQGVQHQIDETQNLSESLQEKLASLNRDFVDSGIAKELGTQLSSLGGPLGKISFQLAHLSIVAGVHVLEGAIISMRDLPKYKRNLAIMDFQHRKIPMDIEIAERKYRECMKRLEARKKLIEEETSSQVKEAPKAGSGMGDVLLIVGGVTAAAAAAVGVAYAAQHGGKKLCCKTVEQHWCPKYKVCCPKGYDWYSPSTNKCYDGYSVFSGKAPKDVYNCRPGGWCD